MFSRIANEEPVMPRYLSQAAKELLTGLLRKDPELRLGYAGDFQEMKKMAFFAKIDWARLPLKEENGPLKPHLSSFYFDQECV